MCVQCCVTHSHPRLIDIVKIMETNKNDSHHWQIIHWSESNGFFPVNSFFSHSPSLVPFSVSFHSQKLNVWKWIDRMVLSQHCWTLCTVPGVHYHRTKWFRNNHQIYTPFPYESFKGFKMRFVSNLWLNICIFKQTKRKIVSEIVIVTIKPSIDI